MSELTFQLQKSLQFNAMRRAIDAAIPLLRSEQESLAQVLAANKGKSSYALEAIEQQHDEWLAVINQCEVALNPVPVSKPDVIPQLQCPICTKDTPGTVNGMCWDCYGALHGLQAVAGTVVEMPRRVR